MSTNTFDADAFLTGTTISEANSVEFVLPPEGEYVGLCSKLLGARRLEATADNPPRIIVEYLWELNDSDGKLKETTGRDKNAVRQSIWLDLSSEGGIAGGRGVNVALGRTREAVGLNDPSRPFNFSMIVGRTAKLGVKHRVNKDTGEIYAEVRTVSKL
jgi:hypothetical protein